MKLFSKYTKLAVLALPLLLASCHSQKTTVAEKPATTETAERESLLKKVVDNNHTSQYVTSKLKFTIELGPQQVSLTGNLRMKRDDVIRLQLMAFGFVEAGRIEFTKDDVLIMDRINKQYMKAPYEYVEFLRNSGLNFYSLQALFWNELFQPGQTAVNNHQTLEGFNTTINDDEAIVNYEKGKMSYNWLVDEKTGRINITNIMYRDANKGNTQLTWEYNSFFQLAQKAFPNDMKMTLTTPDKEVKMTLKLNHLGTDNDWESRTTVSNKYREVSIDDILRRIMAL